MGKLKLTIGSVTEWQLPIKILKFNNSLIINWMIKLIIISKRFKLKNSILPTDGWICRISKKIINQEIVLGSILNLLEIYRKLVRKLINKSIIQLKKILLGSNLQR